MRRAAFGIIPGVTFAVLFALAPSVYADERPVIVEKSVIGMSIPADGKLPWAVVEGMVIDPAAGYPVLIQMYDGEGLPVHFAQTPVNQDGSYEYRFRVTSVNDGQKVHAFEGDYTVEIFKTVYLTGLESA